MHVKLILLFAFGSVVKASFIQTNHIHPPIAADGYETGVHEAVKSDEYDPHPRYRYSYAVEDKLTGDFKSQHEERDGDAVYGEYSLIDADGYKRTVKYSADDDNGFRAVVERVPEIKSNVNLLPSDAEYHKVDFVEQVAKSIDPASQYASRYTSYDAPIYLQSALLASSQH